LIKAFEHGSLGKVKIQVIQLHRQAPPKPTEGEPCNGCGICCTLETCPAGRLRFLQKAGPCPALEWVTPENRYHCGLLTRPSHYLRWLPHATEPIFRRLFIRWIAAGKGCDCNASEEN
jgi:hypothetical protein